MKKILSIFALAAVAVGANAQSFSENFDVDTITGTPASGTVTAQNTWNYTNNSVPIGVNSWFQGNTAVFTQHGGTGYLGVNFNSGAGTSNLDNWLMSQVRTFKNGDTISFWSRTVTAPAFPDRMYLKFSKSGASLNIADFTTTLVTINPTLTVSGYPNAWTQFTGTISGLSGATAGRFAFNYNVPNGGPAGANSDYVGLDDVQYTATTVPEPATMAALGIGIAALLRRRRASK
jgi:hypothetical protein